MALGGNFATVWFGLSASEIWSFHLWGEQSPLLEKEHPEPCSQRLLWIKIANIHNTGNIANIFNHCKWSMASLMAHWVKKLPAMQETHETHVWSPGGEDPPEEETATYFSILAWRIPRTEESGGLQSKRSQRVRHDWAPKLWIIMLYTCNLSNTVQQLYFNLKEREIEMHQPLRMDHLGWDTFSADDAMTGRVTTHPWCSQLCGQPSLFLMAIVFFYVYLFIYFAILHGMVDLSSPTKFSRFSPYWTHALCSGNTEFEPLDHQGNPHSLSLEMKKCFYNPVVTTSCRAGSSLS